MLLCAGPFQLLSEFSLQQATDASTADVSPQSSATKRTSPSKQILEKATQQAALKVSLVVSLSQQYN